MKRLQSSHTAASANPAEASFTCANIARLDAVMASIIIFCVSLLVRLITQLG